MFEVDLEQLQSEEAKQFYAQYKGQNISDLLLKYGNDPIKKGWCLQLDSRSRAQKKLPEWFYNQQIIFPPKFNLEQASSEIAAKFKASLIPFKTSVDLTGGSGIDSWAISQKAMHHTYVEVNSDLYQLTKHNFSKLGISNCDFVNKHAEEYLEAFKSNVDLIYIDPSRRTNVGKKVIRLEDYTPNVIQLQEQLLNRANHVLIKVSPIVDLSYLRNIYKNNLFKILVVAVQNEVKEILILLQRNCDFKGIFSVNLDKTNTIEFSYAIDEENTKPNYAEQLKAFLYEPNAAVLKAGAFNTIANRYNLEKLDKNSHLYTSIDFSKQFPGRIYQIIEVASPFKLKGSYPESSIISRNYPQKPESIRKRLKIKDGNAFRIFATTLNGKKVFIATKPLLDKPY